MPDPIAVCIEDLGATGADDRFMRCVAVRGGSPGLALDASGRVAWMQGSPTACELWVSADERLILWRTPHGPVVTVHREGRYVEAPPEKPVVLLDQDEVRLGGRRIRIHIHGVARAVHAPAPLVSRPIGRMATIAAAAFTLAGTAGCKTDADRATADAAIEVREAPPSVAVPEPDASAPEVPDAAPDAGADAVADAADSGKDGATKPSIEVRTHPPKPAGR